MKNHRDIALLELKKEKDQLLLRLGEVDQAIAVLQGTGAPLPPARPSHRADVLLDYLKRHLAVPVKNVPAVLAAMGHESRAAHATTNWLYQLPLGKQYFIIKDGLVTLRPSNNGSSAANPSPVAGKDSQASSGAHRADGDLVS